MTSNAEQQFAVEVLDFLPDEEVERFYFPGPSKAGGHDGVIVKLTGENERQWVGVFAFGNYPNTVSRFCGTVLGPENVVIIAEGQGYFVSANNPEKYGEVDCFPIFGVHQSAKHSIICFHDHGRFVGYGRKGLAWTAVPISTDEIKVHAASEDEIEGRAWSDSKQQFVGFGINIKDGKTSISHKFLMDE